MKKLFLGIFIVVLLAGLGAWAYAKFHIGPCSLPIQYSIGQFDTQFGINQQDFLQDLEHAASIWSGVINKPLFEYDPNGPLKINLIYDERQDTANKLKTLGINIEDTKDSYDQLKARYITLKSDYELHKANFETQVADYQKKQASYTQQVSYWNSRGGAPKDIYDQLASQKTALDRERAQITTDQNNLNKLVANLNVIVDALNQLGKKLNLNIANYNNIGASQGSEFEEGVYVEDSLGRHIDIYEFDNQARLTRLLAHELGHSLGLQHVEDQDAIMYRLNASANQTPTPADIAELKEICKLP